MINEWLIWAFILNANLLTFGRIPGSLSRLGTDWASLLSRCRNCYLNSGNVQVYRRKRLTRRSRCGRPLLAGDSFPDISRSYLCFLASSP